MFSRQFNYSPWTFINLAFITHTRERERERERERFQIMFYNSLVSNQIWDVRIEVNKRSCLDD